MSSVSSEVHPIQIRVRLEQRDRLVVHPQVEVRQATRRPPSSRRRIDKRHVALHDAAAVVGQPPEAPHLAARCRRRPVDDGLHAAGAHRLRGALLGEAVAGTRAPAVQLRTWSTCCRAAGGGRSHPRRGCVAGVPSDVEKVLLQCRRLDGECTRQSST